MSEYQCYEFVTIDRPLTTKQMAELRAISTRAEITSTRFWNEYEWGDLKADPAKLVERYFDAHLYFANWGTHRLMLRIPVKRVEPRSLRTYFVGDPAHVRVAGEHLILDLHSEDEDRDYYEESQGSLGALAAVRTELMRGDLRVAYLAWLLAVQTGNLGDEDAEPPVPPGLSDLTAAQAAMAEFLRIDGDLLAAAAMTSVPVVTDPDAMRAWILGLTTRAKEGWLMRAAADPDLMLGAELHRASRATAKAVSGPGRRVADLRAGADEVRAKRERADALARKETRTAAEAARRKRLGSLARRVDAAWVQLETLVEKSAYEDAIHLATDLRDLAQREGASVAFEASFEAMRKRQLRRRGFFDRWKRESLPERRRVRQ